jgi:MFS family permease
MPQQHEVREALEPDSEVPNQPPKRTQSSPQPREPNLLSKWNLTATVISITCSTSLSAIVNGMFTVSLPAVVADVRLDSSLILWPQSIVAVVSACTLLLCGSLADIFGGKLVYILGSIFQTAFILGSGLAQTGLQLLVFRGLMGLAQSMCLPSSVSVITSTFPPGRSRNVAFSCMGGGQPVGFALGLILGGVLTDAVSWRVGLYSSAGLNAVIVIMATFGLEENQKTIRKDCWFRFQHTIDWVGLCIASVSLALLCYLLA